MQRVLTRARNDGAAVMVLYTLTRLAMIDLAGGRWTDAVGDVHRGRHRSGRSPATTSWPTPRGHPDAAARPTVARADTFTDLVPAST